MAEKCANCRSFDVQHDLLSYKCLACGSRTDYEGRLLPAEVADLAPNIADGQRQGDES